MTDYSRTVEQVNQYFKSLTLSEQAGFNDMFDRAARQIETASPEWATLHSTKELLRLFYYEGARNARMVR